MDERERGEREIWFGEQLHTNRRLKSLRQLSEAVIVSLCLKLNIDNDLDI